MSMPISKFDNEQTNYLSIQDEDNFYRYTSYKNLSNYDILKT